MISCPFLGHLRSTGDKVLQSHSSLPGLGLSREASFLLAMTPTVAAGTRFSSPGILVGQGRRGSQGPGCSVQQRGLEGGWRQRDGGSLFIPAVTGACRCTPQKQLGYLSSPCTAQTLCY